MVADPINFPSSGSLTRSTPSLKKTVDRFRVRARQRPRLAFPIQRYVHSASGADEVDARAKAALAPAVICGGRS
jgi:hypothetical protein